MLALVTDLFILVMSATRRYRQPESHRPVDRDGRSRAREMSRYRYNRQVIPPVRHSLTRLWVASRGSVLLSNFQLSSTRQLMFRYPVAGGEGAAA